MDRAIRLHQYRKARLSEMAITGQRLGYAVFPHHNERYTIHQPPGFIGMGAI